MVCRDDEAPRLMPQRLLTMREAIDAALEKREHGAVETAWSDAGSTPWDPDWASGTLYVDQREIAVAAPPAVTFGTAAALDGDTGRYWGTWLWRVRGFFDKLLGGPWLRLGVRDPQQLLVGDALDFWRVVAVVPGFPSDCVPI